MQLSTSPVLPSWLPVWHIVLFTAIFVSLAVLWALTRPWDRWGVILRKRFVLGVPWGTLLTAGIVLAVYLFVQGGLSHWTDPVVLPFRAWSYFYPLGILTAGFAHAGAGHLTANLLATLVFGSLAEYAWGHFPTAHGSSTFSSLRTNPFARILAFVGTVIVISLFGAAFGLGPVIGFSGVVFAFVGFALVRYPVPTIIALLASDVVRLVHRALRSPVVQARSSPSFSSPWWADIAIQGHALGLFVGVALGVLLVHRRRISISPTHLWLAALIFAVDRGLWAIYTIRSTDRFVLFRALGTGLAFLLAALIAAAQTASGRDLITAIDLSRREAAVGLFLAVLIALATVGVPYNLFVVDDPTAGVDETTPVEVRDYTVFYAEDVPNQLVSAIPFDGLGRATTVNASGVIVVSERRNIWWDVIGKRALAFAGERRVRLGGITWRDTVVANRTGWSAVDGPTAYSVRLKPAGGEWRLAYVSDPARAAPTIAGRNISVVPGNSTTPTFDIVVARQNETLDRAVLPSGNASVEAGGLTFVREGDRLVAVRNNTRVPIAQKETYRGGG